VGATYCLDRIYEGHEALCIHNPATSREATMPHVIARAGTAKSVVIVGAGPAGLEAARVAGERGHKVTVFEAAPQAGGQIRLATQIKRRRELIGIVDWRVEQCERLGIDMRYSTYADASDVLSLSPDVVIIATGGLAQNQSIEEGADLAVSSWDILSGDVKPAGDVLLFDDSGAHPGMTAAEFIAEAGSSLELVSPERFFAPDMGGLNLVPYMKTLTARGTTITTMTRVRALARDGNRIRATLWSPYTMADCGTRTVDQVVVENGTSPLDDLYFALKDQSVNRGEVDYQALIGGLPQAIRTNPEGAFQLFRIGDAVASRNIHAAIYDALRLVKDI
jgi:NADPH-dependent 2,4-dienoyl-CoA reductase/sulfur reductase-like enzyme